jgi:hypothetical protein
MPTDTPRGYTTTEVTPPPKWRSSFAIVAALESPCRQKSSGAFAGAARILIFGAMGRGSSRRAIVLKCLEKDPSRHYATVRDLVRDLTYYQSGERVQARPEGELQRAWR